MSFRYADWSEITMLEKQLTAAETRVKELELDWDVSNRMRQQADNANEKNGDIIMQLMKDKDELKQRLAAAHDANAARDVLIESLQAKLAAAEACITFTPSPERWQEAQSQLRAAQEQLAEAKAEITAVANQRNAAIDEGRVLLQRLTAAEDMSETRRQILTDSFENVTNLCAERDSLKLEITGLKVALSNLKDDYGILCNKLDWARDAARSYRKSWSYSAFSTLIPLNKDEQLKYPWLEEHSS